MRRHTGSSHSGHGRTAARTRFRHLDKAAPRVPREPICPGEALDRYFIEMKRHERFREELRAWEESGSDIVPW